jgi:hypothetical protein
LKAFEDKKKCKSEEDDQQPPLKKFHFASSSHSDKSESYTAAVTKYLITSMRPMSEVENEGFVEMFSQLLPGYQLPCRKTIRGKVLDQCELVRQKIIQELGSTSYCAGQADIWSSRRMHGYFGLVLSYIVDGVLTTRVVACRRFVGSHTGENIAGMFSNLAQEFKVSHKFSAMVTDNAANMLKAFRTETTSVEESGKYDEDDISESNEEPLVRIGVQWDEIQDDIAFAIPTRYSCVAHSLQLVVADGLKEATDRNQAVNRKIQKTCCQHPYVVWWD